VAEANRGISLMEAPCEIDNLDWILLTIIQDDAELSLSAIGARLGLSKMAASNRIKRLKRLGFIGKAHYQVDPVKVGQDYVLLIQLESGPGAKDLKRVAPQIARMPEVQAVYETYGAFNVFVVARTRDRESAREFVYRINDVPGVTRTVTTIPSKVIKESLKVDLRSGEGVPALKGSD